MARFRRFLAIDWSGAAGERHKGIALAQAEADGGPPVLIRRKGPWSRPEVVEHLRQLPADTLVGVDLGISLPFDDCRSFFPGWDEAPTDAPALWAEIDRICAADPHLAATSFVERLAPWFRLHGGREGARFHTPDAPDRRGRFRVTERAQADMGCKPYSNFNLVGAAQVGKSSLTGMRMLHQLRGALPVWPVDDLPDRGSVLVEIYTTLAAREAGRSAAKSKMRTVEELNAALGELQSPAVAGSGPIDDHSSDALLTAAWLRKVADDPRRWHPPRLTRTLACTEGWTFGAL